MLPRWHRDHITLCPHHHMLGNVYRVYICYLPQQNIQSMSALDLHQPFGWLQGAYQLYSSGMWFVGAPKMDKVAKCVRNTSKMYGTYAL